MKTKLCLITECFDAARIIENPPEGFPLVLYTEKTAIHLKPVLPIFRLFFFQLLLLEETINCTVFRLSKTCSDHWKSQTVASNINT